MTQLTPEAIEKLNAKVRDWLAWDKVRLSPPKTMDFWDFVEVADSFRTRKLGQILPNSLSKRTTLNSLFE